MEQIAMQTVMINLKIFQVMHFFVLINTRRRKTRMVNKIFTYEDGYEDGCNSKKSEVLDILIQMELENGYDNATLEEIKKRLGY